MDDTPDNTASAIAQRIELEAIAWFTRMNGEPSAADRRNFATWQAANEAHALAYDDIVQTWTAAEAPGLTVAEESADVLGGYFKVIQQNRTRRKRLGTAAGLLGLVMAFCAGFAVWLEYPNVLQDMSADYVSARAERKPVTLADGSAVLLDADSAIADDTDQDVRRVRLLRGTAYFDVVHSDRPFIVEAGQGEVLVTGTAFSVDMRSDDVAVTLERGRVSVSSHADNSDARLEPGQGISYGATGLGAVAALTVEDAMAWKEGRFIFENQKLSDVLSQIGRYQSGRIVILTPGLGDKRVSGNLPLDRPASALASLQASVGFALHTVGDRLVLVGP